MPTNYRSTSKNHLETYIYNDHLTNNPFPNNKYFDSSEFKEFANDNFKFYENGRQLSKRVENTVGKGEIARHEQFLHFPLCFRETCTADT